MKIIFGLGNPGEKYLKTRHNLGFMFLDLFAKEYSVDFKSDSKSQSEIAEFILDSEKVLLCKPQSFMNNSGETVSSLMKYFKVAPEDVLVIHDEIDLHFGQIKIAEDSSSAGHKGVQSIIDHLQTKAFKRIRFGVKIEENKLPVEIFVLKNFSKDELDFINKVEIKKLLLDNIQ